jgi:hypothetical protein
VAKIGLTDREYKFLWQVLASSKPLDLGKTESFSSLPNPFLDCLWLVGEVGEENMRQIPILEPDGSEPLAICRAHRSWMIDRYKIDAMAALWYYSDEPPVSERDLEADQKAKSHITTCPKCRVWIHFAIPDNVMRRQQRLTRYCCAGMFVATEEYKESGTIRISFELFRGEDPCWLIDENRAFISYCPWCGKKLPAKPFIEE